MKLTSGVGIGVFALALLGAAEARAQETFTRRILDEDEPGGVATADFDGDGFPDIAAARSSGRELTSIRWYRYDPCTKDWEKHFVAEGINFRGDDLAADDIDGDGDPDIVGTIDDDGKLFWYENPHCRGKGCTGDPASGRWRAHPVGGGETCGGYVKDLAVADFDRDGDADIVTRTEKRLTIWLQGPDAAWTRVSIPGIPPREGMDVGDLDGDKYPDIVLNGYWFAAPGRSGEASDPASWRRHDIDRKWYTHSDAAAGWRANASKVELADIDGDGRLDVLLSQAEMSEADFPDGGWDYPVTWYRCADPKRTPDLWIGITLLDMGHCQTLQAADMDGDGDTDVVAARFQRDAPPESEPPWPVMVCTNEGRGMTWSVNEISEDGMYSGTVADLGSDGDIDIIGPRSYWLPPIEIWENRADPDILSLDRWTHIEVDSGREGQCFGLAAGDLDGDGDLDIVSGKYMHRNPGGDMTGPWERVELPAADAMWVLDVDGDEYGDVIAYNSEGLFWFEAKDADGRSWSARKVGPSFGANHGISTQGYTTARIDPDSPKPAILFSTGVKEGFVAGIVCFEIPSDPESVAEWPHTAITRDDVREGIAAGDIDGDGLVDVCGKLALVNEGRRVAWWKNPGNGSGNWERFDVGDTESWADRIRVADVNCDGMPDVIVTEEKWNPPDKPPFSGLATYCFLQKPSDGIPFDRSFWERTVVAEQYTTNSLDTADMDHDGDTDIVTGEHRGTKNVIIWENRGGSEWTPHPVDSGKESHLGARLFDLDGDGDLDIVSIGWDNPAVLHVWRNDAVER